MENLVRGAGFPHWIIIRPVTFLQNFIPPRAPIIFPSFQDDLTLRVACKPTTKLAWLDSADIGIVVAAATSHPEVHAGRAFELAAEALTMDETAAKISKAIGRQVKVHYYSDKEALELADKQPWLHGFRLANSLSYDEAVEGGKDFALTSVDEFFAKNASLITP